MTGARPGVEDERSRADEMMIMTSGLIDNEMLERGRYHFVLAFTQELEVNTLPIRISRITEIETTDLIFGLVFSNVTTRRHLVWKSPHCSTSTILHVMALL